MSEKTRDECIDDLYESWCARDLAERVIDLEEEAGQTRAEYRNVVRSVDQLRRALADVRADAEYFQEWATGNGLRLNTVIAQRDRFALAWESARRRAAHESVMATAAVDHLCRERDRWRAGHERAESQLVQERRENERLRALVDEVR